MITRAVSSPKITPAPLRRAPRDVFDVQPLSAEQQAVFAALETVVERGLRDFIDVGNALAQIRDERLYTDKFANFEAYSRVRWGFSRSYADRVIEAAQTATMLPMGIKPATERVARELRPLKGRPEIMTATYKAVEKEKPNATAAEMKRAVRAVVAMPVTTPERAATAAREAVRSRAPRPAMDRASDRTWVSDVIRSFRTLSEAPQPYDLRKAMTPTEAVEIERNLGAARAWIDAFSQSKQKGGGA
jgi:hypothetical protein